MSSLMENQSYHVKYAKTKAHSSASKYRRTADIKRLDFRYLDSSGCTAWCCVRPESKSTTLGFSRCGLVLVKTRKLSPK